MFLFRTAVKLELVDLRSCQTLVGQGYQEALVEEGELPQAVGEHVEAEDRRLEYGGICGEADDGTAPVGFAHLLHILDREACFIHLVVYLALMVDEYFAPCRQGVDHGDADAVESSRDLVCVLVEFAACVELGHYQLEGADLLDRVDTDGDAAAVVGDLDDVVLLEYHVYPVAVAREGFVYRIVDHLVDEMVEAVDAGRTDVHARSLPDCLQAFQNLDACC